MRIFGLTLMTLALVSCASLSSNSTSSQLRNPAQAVPDDGGAACRSVLPGPPSRPNTAEESSIAQALLNPDLNDFVFDAIFGAGCHHIRPEVVADFQTFDAKLIDKSATQVAPIQIFASGMNMASSLIAINRNIYFEGFYRNIIYEGNHPEIPEPWLRWDANSKQYVLEKAGAEAQLLQEFLKQPGIINAVSGKIRLYRGTTALEKTTLIQIRTQAGKPATKAQAEAQSSAFAAKLYHGLFATNMMATAKSYAQQSNGVLLTTDIPQHELAALLNPNAMQGILEQGHLNRGLYVGYEYTYFELAFLSGEAVYQFADGLIGN